MDTTHPKKGRKVSFRIQDCDESRLPRLRPLESMKGLRLFIVYRKSESSNDVIELESLDEFGKAQTYAAYHSWPFVIKPDVCLMINLGHADLNILVDYLPNKVPLAEFLKTVNLSPGGNYSGRPIEELMTP
ncbi:MAG: hypothetical protein LUQ59_03290 [Methanothrix sp.]|nr:hypothetical protein [Methanothrix sp.]